VSDGLRHDHGLCHPWRVLHFRVRL
jgi:hypothetical protein